jgi:hypothetical protein
MSSYGKSSLKFDAFGAENEQPACFQIVDQENQRNLQIIVGLNDLLRYPKYAQVVPRL